MLLDTRAAEALFSIVIAATQGSATLHSQMPIVVVDQGEDFLVKGTPFTDRRANLRFCSCHMIVAKRSAEILGVGCEGRANLSKAEEAQWKTRMSVEDYDRVFNPSATFLADGIPAPWLAVYGGVVPTAEAATRYAAVVLQADPRWPSLDVDELEAVAGGDTWHIRIRGSAPFEVLTIAKTTGKVSPIAP